MVGKAKTINLNLDHLINFGLYLWVFLLPLQTRLILRPAFIKGEFWEYGSISLYASEVLLVFIFALFVIKIFKHKLSSKIYQSLRQNLFEPKINFFKIVLVLFLWLFLSFFWTTDFLITATRVFHLLFSLLAVLIISYQNISFWHLGLILTAAGVGQGIFSINQFLEQRVWASSFLGIAKQLPGVWGVSVVQAGADRWLRAYGTLPHPNILGGLQAIVFIFLSRFIFWFDSRSRGLSIWQTKIFRLSLYGSLFFVVTSLLLSFSRAAWLAVLLVFFYWGFIFFKNQKKLFLVWIKIGWVAVITLLVWFSFYPAPFITRIQGQEVLERQSLAEREISYQDSGSVLGDYYLTGSGLGTYTKVLSEKNSERKLFLNQPVHNSWILILSELGFLGLLVFLFFFYLGWKQAAGKFWINDIYLAVFVLLLFDHWWVSLIFGNYLLALILLLGSWDMKKSFLT